MFDTCAEGRSGKAGEVISLLEHARAEFPGAPPSVRAARSFVREALRHWHLDVLEDTAISLVSELATNALLHAHTSFAIELTRTDRRLRISVLDSSPAQPSPRR